MEGEREKNDGTPVEVTGSGEAVQGPHVQKVGLPW